MEFNYFYTATAIGNLSIEDIYKCAVEANNDDREFYYLVIDSKLGFSKIFQYGPLVKDSDIMHKSVKCSFKRIEVDQFKIEKEIKGFLNNPFANITQAVEIPINEALANCKSLIEYMKDSEAF